MVKGGRCWAEVVVDLDSNIRQIDYPRASEPYDALIVLSEEAARDIKPNFLKKEDTGFLIWDSSTINRFRAAKKIKKALSLPVQKLSIERFGNTVFGNSIIFGAFTIMANIFSEESAIQTIKKFVPSPTLSKNLEAFELGKQKGQEFISKLQEAA